MLKLNWSGIDKDGPCGGNSQMWIYLCVRFFGMNFEGKDTPGSLKKFKM